MTIQENLISMLCANGFSNRQAEIVFDLAKPELESLAGNYQITFNRPSSEYPQVVHNILFSAMKPTALKWIEENCPMAWFKPMFQ